MKRLFLLLSTLVSFSTLTTAQDILCANGQRLHSPITITAPAINVEDAAVQPLAFVIASDSPMLVETGTPEQSFCISDDPATNFLSVTLPNVALSDAPYVALATPLDLTQSSLTFGTVDRGAAQFLLLTSRLSTDSDGDEYTLTITPQMRRSGVPLTMYALSVDGSDVGLRVVNENGKTVIQNDITLECDNAGVEPCIAPSLLGSQIVSLVGSAEGQTTDAALTIDLATWEDDLLRFRVAGDAYMLAVSVANDVLAQTIVLRATLLTDGNAFVLTCDDQLAWTDGISVTFPAAAITTGITVTALGASGNDPVLALVDDNGNGTCTDDSAAALPYAINLPGYSLAAQINSSQVILNDAALRLFVGNKGDTGGEIFLMVEGLTIVEAQTLAISTTHSMIAANSSLTVWATSLDGSLDSVLTWVTEDNLPKLDFEQKPYICDNAGVFDTCYGQSERLRDYNLTLADSRNLPLDSPDSQLDIPIFPDTFGQDVRVQITGANGTGGDVVLVLRIVSQ